MNIKLIETKEVNNVSVDGYYGDSIAWFTREQIGSALEYDDPTNAIAVIHKRHKERLDLFSRRCQIDTPSGQQEAMIYSTRGVFEICRWSKQPKADMAMDALYDMAEEVIKKGYYSTLPTDELLKRVIAELEYDHYVEDVIIPIIESQDEFSLQDLLEHWVGFPIKTYDDWRRAKPVIEEKCKLRQQRLSAFCHSEMDFFDDDRLYSAIRRYKWGAAENKGHSKIIKGVRWFDDETLNKIKMLIGRVQV